MRDPRQNGSFDLVAFCANLNRSREAYLCYVALYTYVWEAGIYDYFIPQVLFHVLRSWLKIKSDNFVYNSLAVTRH